MKPLVFAAILFSAAFTAGCDRIFSETWGKVQGPKGFAADVRAVDEQSLAKYTNFEIGKFEDETNGRTPRAFFPAIRYEFDMMASENLILNTSGSTLLIRGRIIHYESSSMASEIFGPLEEVVARIQFTDKFTGRVIGEAVCVGRTRETLNRGPEKKAEGLAKAMVGWLESHNPALRRPKSD